MSLWSTVVFGCPVVGIMVRSPYGSKALPGLTWSLNRRDKISGKSMRINLRMNP
ncbi:hypothetical protein [Planktothricoides sp. SR001]|uniref:hypothetical protein n=1 Tax=Planktothricoides sp. SR001 TaxID=1705388 RepID=UPI0012E318EB|nr:hypothetical protein [Planktothricoides sp. SR001]